MPSSETQEPTSESRPSTPPEKKRFIVLSKNGIGAVWTEVGPFMADRPEEARDQAAKELFDVENGDEITLVAVAERNWKPKTGRAVVRREFSWS